MQSILFNTDIRDRDALVTELWEHGTAGIIEEGKNLRAFFDDGADLQPIFHSYAGSILEKRREQAADLQQFERNDWDGILVGNKFFAAPSWANCPVPPGRIPLAIDTTVAFGTGRHESTQVAIEALERYLPTGATVLDVGCGSGILSAAASLLGAGQIISCDLDPNAVASTQQQVSSPVFLGSADAIRTAAADLVMANISAHVIDALAAELHRITKPDGLLVLAGFVRENTPKQWKPEHVLERGDWLAWICRPGFSRIIPCEPYRSSADWW